MPTHFRKQVDSPVAVVSFPEVATVSPPVLEGIMPNPKLKLLAQVREVMRLKHYSLRTERKGGRDY